MTRRARIGLQPTGLLRSRAGAAAVEMALSAPFLLILLGGAIDLGVLLYDQIQLVGAISAGSEYAFLAKQASIPGARIVSNVQAMVKGQLALKFAASAPAVTASFVTDSSGSTMCCLSTIGGVVTPTCSASATTCPDGAAAGIYLKLGASFVFKPIFPTDGFLSRTVSDAAIGRVQ